MNIEELLDNEVVQEELRNAKDLVEAATILNARGVEISAEQLEAALAEDGELGEDALEDIAGGLKIAGGLNNIAWCGPRPGEKNHGIHPSIMYIPRK